MVFHVLTNLCIQMRQRFQRIYMSYLLCLFWLIQAAQCVPAYTNYNRFAPA